MTQDQQIHPATYHHQPSSASDHAFPILAFAVVSIMGTVLLLVAYYVFVNKFSSNWHHLIILPRWISVSRSTTNDDSFIALSPTMWNRGLDEWTIRKIPTFQYTRRGNHHLQEKSFYGCVVCLNEFQEQDMLRILPNCSHSFHLDCIDIWFQRNANCPLCRTSISGKPASKYPPYPIVAPSSSPQSSHLSPDSLMSGDDDYVVIELGGEDDGVFFHNRQGRGEVSRETQNVQQCRGRSPAFKMEQKPSGKSKSRNRHHVSIMGDECIDVRGKDDQFCIQPIRRSFSLDSAVDRQLYSSVQAIIRQNRQQHSEITTGEGIGSNRVGKSLMFPFGHSRGSRKAVLPVEFDLYNI